MTTEMNDRMALLSKLVECSPNKVLGRTAIMKLVYFLTTLRDVPLGYRFTLYAYGPFDSEVLRDVDYASSLGALSTQLVRYPSGYGYSITTGSEIEEVESLGEKFVQAHQEDIDWVTAEFADLNASELELVSTIVYINRESEDLPTTEDELAQRVHDVKPHFDAAQILRKIDNLREKNLLNAVID